MALHELLIPELEFEVGRTRATLERVPADKADFSPHAKSMPLGKLAAHLAQLHHFGTIVLSTPGLDFAAGDYKPLAFESSAQLVKVMDGHVVEVRKLLAATPDSAWSERWFLRAGDKVFMDANRYAGYRTLFAGHVIHHRAQLGVYLRLLGIPVPSVYGPSADEQ